jgi:hypothetical protein
VNLLSSLAIAAAAGIPPRTIDGSWSTADGFLVLLVYAAAFVVAVPLVAWIDVKLSSRRLFHDIYRELGIGKRPR